MKKLFIFILPIYFTNIFSQDIIVDNSVQYNVTNQYAKFDRYSKHGGFNNYKYENKDRISLPDNFTADISMGQHQKVIGSENWKGNY